MKRHFLAIVAYAVATFATQAVSHFGVNAEHYRTIAYLRAEPIFTLGVLAMLLQGAILSFVFVRTPFARHGARGGLSFAWLAGGFLVSYIALAEAAKESVPAVSSWIAVEASAGLVQFTLFGLLLALVHRGKMEREPVRSEAR